MNQAIRVNSAIQYYICLALRLILMNDIKTAIISNLTVDQQTLERLYI